MPQEPPPSSWDLPPATSADEYGLVGVGADLAPGTILDAYRRGLFPMPLDRTDVIGWWSPDPRGVLEPGALKVSRSLWRSVRDYEIRIDTSFEAVIDECAAPGRDGGWITPKMRRAYLALHRLGWAHSVEAWRDGQLCGGLYGLAIGGLFAGESMFHTRTDASKVALVGLVDAMGDTCRLLDVQWRTDHLASLGVTELDRRDYLVRLSDALTVPGVTFVGLGRTTRHGA